jgi:predicted nucleic acid-binding protein
VAQFLIDSDVLIWVLRNRPDTVALLEQLIQQGQETLACSALSVLEIWAGAHPHESAKTATLLDALEVIPLDGPIARRAAELLRAKGRARDPREWIDAIIAATAMRRHLTLVTYNRRDYPYPSLPLYPLPE